MMSFGSWRGDGFPRTRRLCTVGMILCVIGAGLSAAEPAAKLPVKLQLEPAHPWTPPFGLDRVGCPPDAVVTFSGTNRPKGEFVLAGYRQGTETMRRGVVPIRDVARVRVEAGVSEVALWFQPTGGKLVEVQRAKVVPPAFEAEAAARPESVIHPVDLGTILVPHGWLLLAGNQRATIDVAALKRDGDIAAARVVAWYESSPDEKAKTSLALESGKVARASLDVGAGARSEKKDVLHAVLEDAAGKLLWQKSIRVMRVPDRPRWPTFGAVTTRLRYDAPIPQNRAPHQIDYDKGWEGKLDDVVVSLPNGARFVFWRGAAYCPFWASKSSIGFCYEWAEILAGHGISPVNDCVEPLQDKELRYGRVEIVESTAARVHVRWSYQSCDLDYRVGGNFAVEDYYFYPDGFATRVLTLTALPDVRVETNEFIIFTPQSGYPLEYLPEQLLDLIWPGGKAQFRFPCVRNEQQDQWARLQTAKNAPLMHRVRFDKHDPLAAICYSPWGSTHDLPGFPAFTDRGAVVTPMYWGCHWPLSRGYPTGWAISDRIHETPGHNSMMHAGTPRAIRSRTGQIRDALGQTRTMQQNTWVWLIGMTDADDDALRRWSTSFSTQPPAMELTGARPDAEPFAPERRALRLTVEKPVVTITLTPTGYCVNPVFELTAAPEALARVFLDGQPLDRKRYAWDGHTLWLDAVLSQPAKLRLEFTGNAK